MRTYVVYICRWRQICPTQEQSKEQSMGEQVGGENNRGKGPDSMCGPLPILQ